MVDLLKGLTSIPVVQANEGMLIERDNFYIIPPGSYLAADAGVLHLSPPLSRPGVRMPFDFLLLSLAQHYGSDAAAVVLSGTGTDGSLGGQAIKAHGGAVFVQEPGEADYDGMPQSAIQAGLADFVLPVSDIPEALMGHVKKGIATRRMASAVGVAHISLRKIIDLLHVKTAHDFTLYKEGTLQRRIERRMAMASIGANRMDEYLKLLESDEHELNLLASDLLINVTSFFRDTKVFDLLAKNYIPVLVKKSEPNKLLRIWVAGCSTGEEAYSLAILFLEEISASKSSIKLQVFASDIDADAVALAREGLYPNTISGEVSAVRLARFFIKEEHGFRVVPELRASVIFTVQDVLTDPPFSRIDFVSCRNLLIYLQSKAQERVVSNFDFALRDGGILLLGGAETVGVLNGRFEALSKQDRIYQHNSGRHPGEFGFLVNAGDITRMPSRPSQSSLVPRQTALSELCRRLVLDTFAPAAVLINDKNECLYSLGPTDRYLRLAPGHPTHDLLAMVPSNLRAKLRSAIHKATQEIVRVAFEGGEVLHDGVVTPFSIDVQPVSNESEPLVLVCFVDAQPKHAQTAGIHDDHEQSPRISALERELQGVRAELQGAIRNLEISGEEQKVINQEALSVNEEYQSTNEELLTSKEELQSLNEELTALNSQLQETLERQRTTANDLQNVLYSTDVATLFLDLHLNIRFFTPATKVLFNLLPGDIGRPLTDMHSLASDDTLASDANAVLLSAQPFDREISTPNGLWFIRRTMPYRTHDDGIEGVVITYTDITERKATKERLEEATKAADLANLAKSRFLAAASHDLRQPLQTLALVQGLLGKEVLGEKAQKLIKLFDQTADSMSSMVNTLLDINQIDAGIVRPEIISFPLSDVLVRLQGEFEYLAQVQGLIFHIVPCSLIVRSDPRLLEQMIRNLLANALKYTSAGKVLLGCRRNKNNVRIEIWDTGIGIPNADIEHIFEEYFQLDNAARERSRGLGLGLSIVQRLSALLGHPVHVKSRLGLGSVFSIDLVLSGAELELPSANLQIASPVWLQKGEGQKGSLLVVEDDPELRGLLEILLKNEGYHTAMAADGVIAQDMVARGAVAPDLILVDFNLPNGPNGIETSHKIRSVLGQDIPVIVLTGDISTDTLRGIAQENFLHLKKPVKLPDINSAIERLLAGAHLGKKKPPIGMPHTASVTTPRTIFIVDDDAGIREAIRVIFEQEGWRVKDYVSAEAFLDAYRAKNRPTQSQAEITCLIIDAYLPGMSGLELLQSLHENGDQLPSIMITGNGDVQMAVKVMRAGASDFVEKPVSYVELLASVARAVEQSADVVKQSFWQESATTHVAGLTSRQHQIMEMVIAGHPSKNIAADLGISQRTVENHRAAIMKRTESKSIPALARVAFAAGMKTSRKP
ncbi:protein-glutamate methylesterase [Acidocella aquatica]|uniref:histidine kinase n=2 Tax=Acidocella aquatica TaxID=1922313 RepID=A0ABQ5ZYX1_9PROT|nr:protein-glutamate methylesterase [Acidocella aquatica]